MNILNFLANFLGNTGPGFGFKSSIILADFKAGTRSITLQPGTYRTLVVGGGGGHHATPGSAAGGTSSWGATHSATGGAAGAAGGLGTGGGINTAGSSTAASALSTGGGASGTRLGGPPDIAGGTGGCGWSEAPTGTRGGIGAVDGFGLGLPPGTPLACSVDSTAGLAPVAFPGQGATVAIGNFLLVAGIGAGGAGGVGANDQTKRGGAGGGGAGGDSTYPGSGGGLSELVITVTGSPTAFSYTVGAGGAPLGGSGLVLVEKLA